MAKPNYMEVQETITALVNAHRKADDGYEYAATTGTLNSILALLIGGEISRKDAFESLEDAIKRANSYSQ